MIRRIERAAARGVRVRLFVPANANNWACAAAQHFHHERLLDAGVRILDYPAMLHAKAFVRDGEEVIAGTCNLEAWSLKRFFEIDLQLWSAAVAAQFEERFAAPAEAVSAPGKRLVGRKERARAAGLRAPLALSLGPLDLRGQPDRGGQADQADHGERRPSPRRRRRSREATVGDEDRPGDRGAERRAEVRDAAREPGDLALHAPPGSSTARRSPTASASCRGRDRPAAARARTPRRFDEAATSTSRSTIPASVTTKPATISVRCAYRFASRSAAARRRGCRASPR